MDKALLLQAHLPEDEVELEVGTVRVRGLSRAEVLELIAADTSAPGSFERKMLALAMLDPALTEDEVEQWQRSSSPSELHAVASKVSAMSALVPGAAKEKWKEFESDPDAEFHVPPGPDAGDDGGAAPGGDER